MDLAHHLHGALATYGYFAILLIVGMESAGIPMPGETVAGRGGDPGRRRNAQLYGVIGAAAAGAIIGDNCGYWVGREFGFPLALPIRPLRPAWTNGGSSSASICF